MKIHLALKEKNMSISDLAFEINDDSIELEKKLSQELDLTLKVIVKIEMILGIDLIQLQST